MGMPASPCPIAHPDEGDVEWAIEEFGVRETDQHTIIEVDG
jgi:hypothetical protein